MLSGKKLQYLRILKGFTQKYMAESIGITERWVGKIENQGEVPSQDVYDKWLLTIYGKLKPKATNKTDSPKVGSEKKK